MDIEIVNNILRLCFEQQTCLFEIPYLSNYFLEHKLCPNSKYILASIRNYLEIFKISRDQNRIEFYMPYEICRKKFLHGICQNNDRCSNIHLCYDYFYNNLCRRSQHCPYPHQLTNELHESILGTLINLDLDALTKAFKVYCQSNKHVVNHNLLKEQLNSSKTAPSMRMITSPQINGNSTWKMNNRTILTPKIPRKEEKISTIYEKGLQICWKPQKDIQTHFIEVVFSNQIKSDGGPIQTHQIYQHLGVAQVFYQHSEIADRVVLHGPVTFQSFTFIPRLLQRTVDMRHICLTNFPIETDRIDYYIDMISMPYKKQNFQYYQNDKQMIIVEYDEDIDFSKISTNIRNHPECDGYMINCIQLYLPEVLLIEYEQEYSEDDIRKLFDKQKIFHIKTYSYCSFVHFYSHDDLLQSLNKTYDTSIRLKPIYIDIYSQGHLNDYLQQRQTDIRLKSQTISSKIDTSKKDFIDPTTSSVPILPPPPINQQTEISPEPTLITQDSQLESLIEDEQNESNLSSDNDNEDDFHDIPSEFDDNDLFLDDTNDNNGDMEFLRNAAKNLMSSLAEMEAASAETETIDAPHSLLYGDDYIVTIKNRRFALAFLDYTQFRVEKQRNPVRFRLLASLKKLNKSNKKCSDNSQQNDQISSLTTIETKSNKKKRNKRNKKKKNFNNKEDEIQLSS